jgi:hypothetical protein
MGGFKYFLGVCVGVVILTGCAPASNWNLNLNLYRQWIDFFNALVCLLLFGMPILVIIKLSSAGYATEQKKQNLISAWAGIFAGFALLIIYMVWFPNNILLGSSTTPSMNDFAPNNSTPWSSLSAMILSTLIGMVIGFASVYSLRKLGSCWRLAGVFNLSVVAIILIIVVNFIGGNASSVIPTITPGIGFGIFAHIVFIPGTLTKFFE